MNQCNRLGFLSAGRSHLAAQTSELYHSKGTRVLILEGGEFGIFCIQVTKRVQASATMAFSCVQIPSSAQLGQHIAGAMDVSLQCGYNPSSILVVQYSRSTSERVGRMFASDTSDGGPRGCSAENTIQTGLKVEGS